VPANHPFTSPADDAFVAQYEKDPFLPRSRGYDLVLNGTELGSGSIRIHRREVQEKVFGLLGITAAEAQDRFGFLLEALEHGAPPHGGIALGIDRMCQKLLGVDNIREVIAFPKTARATCLMTGAPSAVSPQELRELSIRVEVSEASAKETAASDAPAEGEDGPPSDGAV